MEDGEEKNHLFIPEMDLSNPSAGEETQHHLQSERTERRGQGEEGVTKVVPCEQWKGSLGKTGIGTLNTPPVYSPTFPTPTTLQSPILSSRHGEIGSTLPSTPSCSVLMFEEQKPKSSKSTLKLKWTKNPSSAQKTGHLDN